jgi:hypothetical protein
MSRFYGTMQGSRGETSRQGTAASGLSGHIRGWNVGGRVEMRADGEEDTAELFVTRGSNGYTSELIAQAHTDENGSTRVTVPKWLVQKIKNAETVTPDGAVTINL